MLDFLAAAGSSLLGFLGQERTNKTNVALSREQMDFQERMSSTAYQRAVADMSASGLNPMLAYSQGGASTPMGSMPQVQNSVAAASSSAAAAVNMMQGIAAAEQNTALADKARAEAVAIRASTLESETFKKWWSARADKEYYEAGRSEVGYNREALSEKSDVRKRQAEAVLAELLAEHEGVKMTGSALDVQRRGATFADDVALRKIQRTLAESDIPRMQANEEFFKKMGPAGQYLRLLLDLFSAGNSARSMAR